MALTFLKTMHLLRRKKGYAGKYISKYLLYLNFNSTILRYYYNNSTSLHRFDETKITKNLWRYVIASRNNNRFIVFLNKLLSIDLDAVLFSSEALLFLKDIPQNFRPIMFYLSTQKGHFVFKLLIDVLLRFRVGR